MTDRSVHTAKPYYHTIAMTQINQPILYTKQGCPWCRQAREVLDERGIAYDERDVTASPVAFAEMRKLSGQTLAPVLDWHGEILADFGAEELVPFLDARSARAVS